MTWFATLSPECFTKKKKNVLNVLSKYWSPVWGSRCQFLALNAPLLNTTERQVSPCLPWMPHPWSGQGRWRARAGTLGAGTQSRGPSCWVLGVTSDHFSYKLDCQESKSVSLLLLKDFYLLNVLLLLLFESICYNSLINIRIFLSISHGNVWKIILYSAFIIVYAELSILS